jgi:putative ABC transport system permease protein
MLRNYFMVALRSFLRQRLYSLINIGGLSAGLVCVMLIYLWVNDEIQKDRFHKDIDHIFRVASSIDPDNGEIITWTHTPGPLAEDIRENISQVEMAARTMSSGGQLFQFEDRRTLGNGLYADPEFFNIFSFEILIGSSTPIGIDKNSIAVSESFAQKIFGEADAVGKIIRYQNQYDLEVKAVFKDIGTESSIKFDYILPFEIFKEIRGDGFTWGNYDHPLYLKLTDASKKDEVTKIINERRSKLDDQPDNVKFYIQPFADMYLFSTFENGLPVGGRIKFVRLFTLVAVFILMVACINFMNLATAKAATRAKEVGVRKVIGAQRRSLIVQFLMESTLMCMVSMVLALLAVYLALPLFNILISKKIEANFLSPDFLVVSATIVLLTGLLAGSYPAFYLSAFKPVSILKGTWLSSFTGASLRKGLVIFQFTLTVILGVSALVVFRQIDYIRSKNMGYNRHGVLTFPNRVKEFDAFRAEALQLNGIINVSRADNTLVYVRNQNGSVDWPGKTDNSNVFFRTVCVDYDYLETMELNLLEGRFFSRDFADSGNFVVTKRAVDVMGLTNPVGQKIKQWGMDGTIVGVVEDFHSQSLQQDIDPIIFFHKPQWSGTAFVRFDGQKTEQVIDALTPLLKKYNPEYPFEFTFLDDDFERLYNNEKVISSLANIFTILTMIISGLGLLGLAAYTAERRRKEISIRKILGATVLTLVAMMSREFIKLSLVACLIGCPAAFYLMTKFLEGYAYHPDLGWDIFVITAVGTLMLALLTVIFQVAKVAMSNPVESLRTE